MKARQKRGFQRVYSWSSFHCSGPNLSSPARFRPHLPMKPDKRKPGFALQGQTGVRSLGRYVMTCCVACIGSVCGWVRQAILPHCITHATEWLNRTGKKESRGKRGACDAEWQVGGMERTRNIKKVHYLDKIN